MAGSDFSMFRALRGGYDETKTESVCAEHGPFPVRVYSENGSEVGRVGVCLQCRDRRDRIEAEQKRAAELAVAHVDAKIPKRFASCTLDGYEIDDSNRAQAEVVLDYAARWPSPRKSGESLLLLGNVGTGKTHLAVGVLKTAISHGDTGRYATVIELIREIRATWRGHGERSERQIIEYFGGVSLLVLDEVGVQYGSDGERVILFDVLNERYERCLPTIVVGNVNVAELGKYLDERSVDRLREGGGRAVVFTGNSRRRAA